MSGWKTANKGLQMFIHVFGDESPPAQQLTSLRETGLKNPRDLESCMRDQTLWGKISSCCLLGIEWKYM